MPYKAAEKLTLVRNFLETYVNVYRNDAAWRPKAMSNLFEEMDDAASLFGSDK
jgi:hypothetical protein